MIKREFVYLWYYFSVQLEQIAGYYLLGVLLGSVISVFGKERINRAFGFLQRKKLGALGVVPACACGTASPLCMYGTIPIAATFSQKGMRDDWLAAFMMGSILLNPQLIVYSAALGTEALAVRIISCFACGTAAGLCVRFFYRDKQFFNFEGFREPASRDAHPNLFLRLVKNIWRNLKATGIYFIIGVGLSAAFQRYVPESFMVRLFGGSEAFGVLMAATVGVPLLQQWMWDGMGLGSAAAFMITGPATKVTNLGAVKIVLGMKRFVLYILFGMTFAFLSGVLIDLI